MLNTYGATSRQALSDYVFYRDKYTCQYCGRTLRERHNWRLLVMEHVVPEALEGPTAEYNVVLACRPCNTCKSRSIWIPRNFIAITEAYPEWREHVIRMALWQMTRKLSRADERAVATMVEQQAGALRVALEATEEVPYE